MIRLLTASVAFCLVTLMFAGVLLVYTHRQDAKAQATLVRFVCAAVEVARAAATEEALARADRFEAILSDIGESCR